MAKLYGPTRINIKTVIISLGLGIVLGSAIWAIQQKSRGIQSRRELARGQAAYRSEDWSTASKCFRGFLEQNPDDTEILKKYAQARLRMRPFEPMAIYQAVAAYQHAIELDPHEDACYQELVRLYRSVRNFEELNRLAHTRLEHYPNDKQAPLWLAESLIAQDKRPAAQAILAPYVAGLEALPDQHDTQVQAYLLMGQITAAGERPDAKDKALEWLNRAIDCAPSSVEALVHRAQFYTDNPSLSGEGTLQTLAYAGQDLEAADALGTDNPHLRFALGKVWMALGDFDRAEAELRALEALDHSSIKEHYLDLKDWHIEKYYFASDLALRRGAPELAADLAQKTLSQLVRPGHRMRVLPSVVDACLGAGRVAEARQHLDEYREALHVHRAQGLRKTLAQAQAQVAEAEARL